MRKKRFDTPPPIASSLAFSLFKHNFVIWVIAGSGTFCRIENFCFCFCITMSQLVSTFGAPTAKYCIVSRGVGTHPYIDIPTPKCQPTPTKLPEIFRPTPRNRQQKKSIFTQCFTRQTSFDTSTHLTN